MFLTKENLTLKLNLKGIKLEEPSSNLSLENLQINLKCQNQDWRFSSKERITQYYSKLDYLWYSAPFISL
jgi:hypothetical protein